MFRETNREGKGRMKVKTIKNSKGNIYYGMHFYPGVAEYQEAEKQPYRIFINESTIRNMGPSFAGRPIFVEHVDDVEESIDELKKEADGWVVESFYNEADGKHWVKFIVCSERGERAIKRGFRLSNAYIPQLGGQGGVWNGVSYQKEVTGGEYEHLAIVNNPRYDESVIMTPEEFKAYCEQQTEELKRLANSKKEKPAMKLKFWNRKPAENAADLEGLSVTLPKSGKEMTIVQLVNAADEVEAKKGMANADDKVKVGDKEMTVGELVKCYEKAENDLAQMAKNEDEDEVENEDEESVDNDEDEAAKKKALELAEHEEKEILEKKKQNSKKTKTAEEKAKAKKNFDALKNAHKNSSTPAISVDLSVDKLARGQQRYGSTH